MIARIRRFVAHSGPIVAVLLFAPALRAQGWITLPNGELGYVTDYTTSGFFQCGDPLYMLGTCTASGNTITLGNGANTMTMVFNGVSGVVTATNTRVPGYAMGTISKTFSGPGQFTFPGTKNINVPLFYFSIAINSSFPVNASGTWQAGYLPLSSTSIPVSCCEGFATSVVLPVVPPAAPYNYSYVIWDSFQGATMTVTPEDLVLTASTGVVPEPAVIWLTASGCLALAPVLWRRRRNLWRSA